MPFRALIPLRPSLPRSLRRSAKSCRRLVGDYIPRAGQPHNEFADVVTSAITALESAALSEDSQLGREPEPAMLAAAASACTAAAEACRSHGLDRTLLRAADSFDRAAALCTRTAA
jgi:hypothetical protein